MSRLPRGVAGHPRQRRLLALIREHPGLCFRDLCRQTAMAAGCVRYHLNVLLRCGLVWEQPLGPRLLHFPGQRPPELSVLGAVETHSLGPLDKRLIALLQDGSHDQLRVLADAAMAGVPSSTVQYHLYRLRRFGLIKERWVGRHVFYKAVPVRAWPDTPTSVPVAEGVHA